MYILECILQCFTLNFIGFESIFLFLRHSNLTEVFSARRGEQYVIQASTITVKNVYDITSLTYTVVVAMNLASTLLF